RDEHNVVEGQRLPDFHRRLLSDGGALYTRILAGKARRRARLLSVAAKPGRDDIGLGGFGAAPPPLGGAQAGGISPQRGEQRPLGAALKHFDDKRPARLENL